MINHYLCLAQDLVFKKDLESLLLCVSLLLLVVGTATNYVKQYQVFLLSISHNEHSLSQTLILTCLNSQRAAQ